MADPKNKGAAARARYAAQSNGRSAWQPAEFVNVNLTDSENEQKRVWCPDYTELFNLLNEEIENGYKFTVKWDERGACCSCFMQHTDDEHENGGLILSARASTPSGAIRDVLFSSRVILGGNWRDAVVQRRDSRESDSF